MKYFQIALFVYSLIGMSVISVMIIKDATSSAKYYGYRIYLKRYTKEIFIIEIPALIVTAVMGYTFLEYLKNLMVG